MKSEVLEHLCYISALVRILLF